MFFTDQIMGPGLVTEMSMLRKVLIVLRKRIIVANEQLSSSKLKTYKFNIVKAHNVNKET